MRNVGTVIWYDDVCGVDLQAVGCEQQCSMCPVPVSNWRVSAAPAVSACIVHWDNSTISTVTRYPQSTVHLHVDICHPDCQTDERAIPQAASATGALANDETRCVTCCAVFHAVLCSMLCCRYESHPQHATAGPTGALLLVTTYAAANSSSSTSSTVGDSTAQTAAAGDRQGMRGTSQQQPQVGSTWMSSRQLLERTIAPAVELDKTDV